jgi:branched-chain amino acid transport system substrate-binding protein
MNKRLLTIVGFLIIASMLFAACQQADTPQQPAASPPPGQDPAPPAAGYTCDDPLGCVEVAQGAPIRIAYFMVVSGPDESLGVDSRRGVELAIADKENVLGHTIDLSGEDDGCSAEGGEAGGTRLAADPTLIGVIGTSCSSAARVALPHLSGAGLVVISPSNTAVDLTLPGQRADGYFRTAHSDSIQGAAAARFAMEHLGAQTAATIHDGSIYAEQLQQVFADTFRDMGGTITSQEAVGPDDVDMRPVLTRIAAQGPDIIYSPIFIRAGAQIASQRPTVAGLENTHLMVADGQFSPDFVAGAGAAVEGTFVSSPDLEAFAGGYDDFRTRHFDRYGEDPISIFHAHAYDATMILLNAIERVAVQDGNTTYIPRQALRDAVGATQNHQGLTGNLTCDENGDCADPQIAVYEYHAGEFPPERIWP